MADDLVVFRVGKHVMVVVVVVVVYDILAFLVGEDIRQYFDVIKKLVRTFLRSLYVGRRRCDNSEREANEELHHDAKRKGSVETGKVLASCRMIKQQACNRTGSRLRLVDSTAVSWIVQEMNLIAHDFLRQRNACLLTSNVSFETTGTGEAMRVVHDLRVRGMVRRFSIWIGKETDEGVSRNNNTDIVRVLS